MGERYRESRIFSKFELSFGLSKNIVSFSLSEVESQKPKDFKALRDFYFNYFILQKCRERPNR